MRFRPLAAAKIRELSGITKKDMKAVSKARKMLAGKTVRKKKTRRPIADNIDLMLEGAVFIVEYDKQGKIISKAEIDGHSVLKALMFLLNQAAKKKKKP